MIEEADSGGDTRSSSPVQIQANVDIGFVRLSMNCRGSWHAALPVALDQPDQTLHFRLRTNTDAHKTNSDFFGAIPQQHSLALQAPAHLRSARSEIRQQEVAGARIGSYAELLKFFLEPYAHAQDVPHVALHGLRVANGRFGGGERGHVDRERRHSAAQNAAKDSAQAMTAPSRKPANPAAFENVRATKSCGYFLIQGTTVTPENSA